MDYQNNQGSAYFYAYSPEQKLLTLYDKQKVQDAIADGEFMEIDLQDFLTYQSKWVGNYIMEGHVPQVDFAFDQMVAEFETDQSYIQMVDKTPKEAVLEASTKLYARFRENNTPDLYTQADRLERVAAFMKEVAESDTTTDYLVVTREMQVLTGFPVLARAIMEKTGGIYVCVVDVEPAEMKWMNVLSSPPFVTF